MAKQCAICDKGSLLFGKLNKLRGKYNPVTEKIRKRPNLQWLSVPASTTKKQFLNHKGKRVMACCQCIKTLNK